MYEPGTILTLREPQSTDDKPYPYDRVKVVGQSPIQHTTRSETPWAGPDATGYIISPITEFGPTVDKPYGELQRLYDIESYPVDPVTQEPITPENNPRNLPSPEQIFAREAANQEPPKPRKPTPSAQDNRKTPEQMLRETQTKEKRK